MRGSSIDLLPFFLRYWFEKVECDELVLACWVNNWLFDRIEDTVAQFVNGNENFQNISYRLEQYRQDDYHSDQFKTLKKMHNEMPRIDWGWYPDLDEFPFISNWLKWKIKKGSLKAVYGNWLDRITEDGDLKRVNQDELLEDQFPCGYRGARRLMDRQHPSVYVGGIKPPPRGHHVCPRIKKSHWITVHHFRYQSNIISRLKERHERKKRKYGKTHAKRQLDYLLRRNGIDSRKIHNVGNVLGI